MPSASMQLKNDEGQTVGSISTAFLVNMLVFGNVNCLLRIDTLGRCVKEAALLY
jgi:hypothetical protein